MIKPRIKGKFIFDPAFGRILKWTSNGTYFYHSPKTAIENAIDDLAMGFYVYG